MLQVYLNNIMIKVLNYLLFLVTIILAETFNVYSAMDYRYAANHALSGDTVLIRTSFTFTQANQFKSGVLIIPSRSQRIEVSSWNEFSMRVSSANKGDTIIIKYPITTSSYNLIDVKEGIVIIFDKSID